MVSLLTENGTIGVHNVAVKNTGEFDEVCGFAVPVDPNYPSSLLVILVWTLCKVTWSISSFPQNQVRFPQSPVPGAYKVLETDYDNFASVYSCDVSPFGKIEYGWVLTRSREPEQKYVSSSHLSCALSNSLIKFHPTGWGWIRGLQKPRAGHWEIRKSWSRRELHLPKPNTILLRFLNFI